MHLPIPLTGEVENPENASPGILLILLGYLLISEIKKGKKWWSCNNATNETVTPPNLKNFPEKNVILPVMK